jgi:glycosyltransferase involved in cell wall biosynthesis
MEWCDCGEKMKKVKIGIFLNIDRESGGMYQACLNMLNTIYKHYKEHENFSFIIFTKASNKQLVDGFSANNWKVEILPEQASFSIIEYLRNHVKQGPLRNLLRWISSLIRKVDLNSRVINNSLNKFLKSFDPDIIFFPNCDKEAYQQETPFFTFIPDLQHLIQPEFKEVGDKYVWPAREQHIRNLVRHAKLLIADSETGKEDILYYYHDFIPNNQSIEILPYKLSDNLSLNPSEDDIQATLKKFKLPQKFFFYPAQFWEHKNHQRIVEAILFLKKRYKLETPVVFCGSSSGKYRGACFKKLKDYVNRNNLGHLVHFLDYVSDLELSVLYKHTTGLVMPTFFGPANIPIVEAWAMGCPVIYSDIRGLKEQAGDAALLVDPRSTPGIANAMKMLWEDDALREQLIKHGHTRYENNNSAGIYNKNLISIIDKAAHKAIT